MPDPHTEALPAVGTLERLAARGWRALEEQEYGDWLLRAGGGFTGRANSALVVGAPPAPTAEAITYLVRWYGERGLRPQAQVPLPGAEAVDAALAAAGWECDEDVLVLTAPLAGWPESNVPVHLAPTPDDAWLEGYRYRGRPLPPVARDVLVNADDPVFAAVHLDPAPAYPAAVARGVVVDGWLCVAAVTVAEQHRRRGLATGLMAALGTWADDRDAHSCLLQVLATNEPALALYRRMGFTEHHRYHYRLAPAAPSAEQG